MRIVVVNPSQISQEEKIDISAKPYFIDEKDSMLAKDLPYFLQSAFLLESDSIKVDGIKMNLDFAYNPQRKQYNSSAILEKLKTTGSIGKIKGKEYEHSLLIVGVDLYSPGLNFVFGEADFQTKVALISTVRLRQEFYGLPENKQLFLERAAKEAVHELGHTYGLLHCDNRKCVMHFSNTLRDTDVKSYSFCKNCKNMPK